MNFLPRYVLSNIFFSLWILYEWNHAVYIMYLALIEHIFKFYSYWWIDIVHSFSMHYSIPLYDYTNIFLSYSFWQLHDSQFFSYECYYDDSINIFRHVCSLVHMCKSFSLQYIPSRKMLDYRYGYVTLSSNASFLRSCTYVPFLMVDRAQSAASWPFLLGDNLDML